MTSPGKPKTGCDESLEGMLSNVEQFIENVYHDLGMTPPQCSQGNRSPLKPRTPDDALSFCSSDNPPCGTTSAVAGCNMDAEILKINTMCENIDKNLRSIGLHIKNDLGNASSSANRPKTSIRRRTVAVDSSDSETIDLINSQRVTLPIITEEAERGSARNDDDDDDVILVSDNLPPVIDLCTPTNNLNRSRGRNISYSTQSNRRRLRSFNRLIRADSTCGESITAVKEKTIATMSESPKIMCSICMESCLQRRPTSTVCGHVYCKGCIENAISITHKCPMCNKKLSKKNIFRIYI